MKRILSLLFLLPTIIFGSAHIGLEALKLREKNKKTETESIMIFHDCHDHGTLLSIQENGLLTAEECSKRGIKSERDHKSKNMLKDHYSVIYFRPTVPQNLNTIVRYSIARKDCFVYNQELRVHRDYHDLYEQSKIPISRYFQNLLELKKFSNYFSSDVTSLDPYTSEPVRIMNHFDNIMKNGYIPEVIITPKNGCIPPEELYFWDEKTEQWIQGYNQPEID